MPDTKSPGVTMARVSFFAKLFGGGTGQKRRTGGWFCPDTNLIAAYLDGSLEDARRARLESHLSDCEYCRSLVGDVGKMQREAAPAAPPALVGKALDLVPQTSGRSRWIFAPLAAAGAVACTVVAALLLRTPEHPALPLAPTPAAPLIAKAGPLPKVSTQETVRKLTPPQPLPSVISPRADSVLSGRSVDFRWKTVRHARYYQVQIVTFEGEPVWQGRSAGTNLSLPGDLVLKDGKYFVWISAMMENGRVEKSDPVGFRIASSR